jgi:hypothetical protein
MTPPRTPFLTTKQMLILAVVKAGNSDGTPIDLDQIVARLPYETSKESLQFSIRALVKREMLDRSKKVVRNGRSHRVIELTELGAAHVSKTEAESPAFIETPDLVALEETLVW